MPVFVYADYFFNSCLYECNPLNIGRLLHYYNWKSPFVISEVSLIFYFCWKSLLANTVNPDQTPHFVASDLVLQCLPMTLLQVPR